jgi:hypothetical protein|tara:strand:- start:534 stop:674 length:141 start_codon:yes stop_codon:yes gene_type:complete
MNKELLFWVLVGIPFELLFLSFLLFLEEMKCRKTRQGVEHKENESK